ncbi:hypothetical protein [Cupriavidus neocaledonicus]|uniref:Uncharacterized protein n=1 Tax=Cupriavidus neocaledonicus TaxID=1040979 RepID=A0ABY1V9D6_9BURK|nr:hypothetical protein [Cupriavidus neocaledonicus]SOZ39239.1 hypothetical protein CBM2605_B150018 [Cupriavidus neocaledonicus]
MMSESDFRQRVRETLVADVPVDVRRAWSEAQLRTWWATVSSQDSALGAYRPHGDSPPIEHVIEICEDLLGPAAKQTS